MADNKLNTQLQAILARLDRVDDDLTAAFSAQLLQAKSFASNPLTSAQGALMLSQFSSRKTFTALANQLPGVDSFKKLQQLDSAALLGSLESRVASAADGLSATVTAQLESAVNDQVAALEQQATALADKLSAEGLKSAAESTLNSATQTLETAISEGADPAVIADLESAKSLAEAGLADADQALTSALSSLAGADALVAQAEAFLGGLKKAESAVTGFLDTLGGIAKGDTDSAIVRGTPPNTNPESQ